MKKIQALQVAAMAVQCAELKLNPTGELTLPNVGRLDIPVLQLQRTDAAILLILPPERRGLACSARFARLVGRSRLAENVSELGVSEVNLMAFTISIVRLATLAQLCLC